MPKPIKHAVTAKVRNHYSFKKIMTGSDLSRRRLPMMSATSDLPGPVVWLTACSHGNEVSGIVVIQEVFKSIRRRLARGAVHAFPLMNPLGFEVGKRHITMSGEDLNRSFPGNANGSLGERIAHQIFETITATEPDLVVDFHNDWIESIPYVLVDHDPGRAHSKSYKSTLHAAGQAGMCVIVDEEELLESLSFNLLLRDIPAFTVELGKPNIVSELNVAYGVEAIWNILADLDMIAPRETLFRYPLPQGYAHDKPLRYSDKPYGAKSGIIRFLAAPGEVVKAGQPLARVVNAFGRRQETLTAVRDGIVLGHSDSSVAFPGVPIMAFGVAEERGGD
ncbi:MAG: succinylglutamate desuccinylase/aspartoacylase family protein [Halioglobus sp.]|nr:succinylglutamate desuccinylase/aspartoacylase family protein [Halioglobus sp.]